MSLKIGTPMLSKPWLARTSKKSPRMQPNTSLLNFTLHGVAIVNNWFPFGMNLEPSSPIEKTLCSQRWIPQPTSSKTSKSKASPQLNYSKKEITKLSTIMENEPLKDSRNSWNLTVWMVQLLKNQRMVKMMMKVMKVTMSCKF